MNLAEKALFPRDLLNISELRYRKWVRAFFARQLSQDAANRDATARSPLIAGHCRADIIVKRGGILAGIQEVRFFLASRKIKFFCAASDGDPVSSGQTIATLEGDARILLSLERTILNFLGRMCGIATEARRLVLLASRVDKKLLISCTRKTLSGYVDKRACLVGGAAAHRLDLADAILIKRNYLAASGRTLGSYIRSVQIGRRVRFVETECTRISQVSEIRAAYEELIKKKPNIPFGILFDNMPPPMIRRALEKIPRALRSKIFTEASGGITAKNIPIYARTGVDVLSLGVLTHSARWLDVSMRIR